MLRLSYGVLYYSRGAVETEREKPILKTERTINAQDTAHIRSLTDIQMNEWATDQKKESKNRILQ